MHQLATSRQKRSHRLSVLLMMVATACITLIELLHGHECAGDGCALCLATTWAQALLLLCAGIGIVRPVIRVLEHVRFVCLRLLRTNTGRKERGTKSIRTLPRPTPLSLGVMLRI